jgi:hypothetical protein
MPTSEPGGDLKRARPWLGSGQPAERRGRPRESRHIVEDRVQPQEPLKTCSRHLLISIQWATYFRGMFNLLMPTSLNRYRLALGIEIAKIMNAIEKFRRALSAISYANT